MPKEQVGSAIAIGPAFVQPHPNEDMLPRRHLVNTIVAAGSRSLQLPMTVWTLARSLIWWNSKTLWARSMVWTVTPNGTASSCISSTSLKRTSNTGESFSLGTSGLYVFPRRHIQLPEDSLILPSFWKKRDFFFNSGVYGEKD